MTAFDQQLQLAAQAIQYMDGARLAQALSYDDAKAVAIAVRGTGDLKYTASNYLDDESWCTIFASYGEACQARAGGDWQEAYSHHCTLFKEFVTEILPSHNDWSLPALHKMALNLRLFATYADKGHDSQKNLEEAASVLNNAFSKTVNDRSKERSRKMGALYIINTMFKAYFTLNNLRLCKNLIRAASARSFPPLKDFPISQQVTYHFYVGRLALFDSDYHGAERYLSMAFSNCSDDYFANKQLVLFYLVPVKMLLGIMPAASLLQRYQLQEFLDLSVAIKQGNLKLFQQAMLTHQKLFIRRGVLLVLEKLKIIAYRNLFKRIARIVDSTRLDLEVFLHILQWLGLDTDMDEVECIVANLIFDKKIKGYLSHGLHKLVTSQNDAFPSLRG